MKESQSSKALVALVIVLFGLNTGMMYCIFYRQNSLLNLVCNLSNQVPDGVGCGIPVLKEGLGP